MEISFVTANFVGRAVNYNLHPFKWGDAEKATVKRLTMEELEEIVGEVVAAGFRSIEIWQAHAWHQTMTPEKASQIKTILKRHDVKAIGYAGWAGGAAKNPSEIEKKFQACQMLGLPMIAGGMEAESAETVYGFCRKYRIKVAVENHPEKNPQEIIDKVEPYKDWMGTAVDTGWWGIQGFDAAEAVRKLAPHIFHVHLKDVKGVGEHQSCQFGQGVVDIKGVVRELKRMGYKGHLSIEHEPEDHDPMPEIIESRKILEGYLKG
jgi:sugar phosphate isomerase/epimerase